MKSIFIIKETQEIIKVLNDSYEIFLKALKCKNPEATSLVDDDLMCKTHDAYALISLGYIQLDELADKQGRVISLEIKKK